MNAVDDILGQAAAWHQAGEQVALATVTETWGSSPRPAGSRMAVTRSGKICGSASGGCIDAAVGLDIGAVTPTEIALSIIAEIVAVRRQGALGTHST